MISFWTLARNYVRFTVPLLSIFLTVTAFLGHNLAVAQILRCEDLFAEKPFQIPTYQPYSELDPELLKNANFKLEGNKLYDLKNGAPQLIGTVLTLDAKYLFQWAEKESNDLLKNIGMDSFWMNFILNGPGQASGKGFYVSTNPTDSASYANGYDAGLAIFKPTRPLITLEFEIPLNKVFQNDTDLVLRVKSLGIDAIRRFGYSRTWLSIIQESQLQQQVSFPEDVYQYLQNNKDENFAYFPRYAQATAKQKDSILKKISADDSFRKLLTGKNLSWDDISALAQRPNGLANYDAKIQTRFFDQGFKLLTTAETPQHLVDLLRTFNSLDPKNLDWIGAKIPKATTATAKKYQALLELFDASVIASLTNLSNDDAIKQFDYMKAAAKSYESKRDTVDFKKIKTADQLIKAAEEVFNTKFEYRKIFAFMSNDSQPIDVTQEGYRILLENTFLTVKEIPQRPKFPGNKVLAVRYWSPYELKANFYGPEVSLDPFKENANRLRADLRKGTDNFENSLPAFFKEVVESVFSEDIVLSLTETAFDPAEYQTPEYLYRLFMSFHPMQDGNGRLGRFIYEFLTARKSKFKKSRFLNLISYDLDLTLDDANLNKQIIAGTVLNTWILEAKTDAEFIQRARWAVEILLRAYPELRGHFTTLRRFG